MYRFPLSSSWKAGWGCCAVIATDPGLSTSTKKNSRKVVVRSSFEHFTRWKACCFTAQLILFLKTSPLLYWVQLISIIYNQSLCCHVYLELHVWLELGTTKSLSPFWVLLEAELLDVHSILQISGDVFSQWYQISTIKCTEESKENKFKNLSGPLKGKIDWLQVTRTIHEDPGLQRGGDQ